jgi:hypothetical protein
MASLFRHLTRVWCQHCDRRTLKIRTREGVCLRCIYEAIEQAEHDDEMRSLRGLSNEDLERV